MIPLFQILCSLHDFGRAITLLHDIAAPILSPTESDILCRVQDAGIHEAKECASRLISCPRGCGREHFPARALEVHFKHECRLRMIKCANCEEQVAAEELDLHKAHSCR